MQNYNFNVEISQPRDCSSQQLLNVYELYIILMRNIRLPFRPSVCGELVLLKASAAADGVLALLIQQVEQSCRFLADEIDAATVVDVVDVVPGDALWPVLLLQGKHREGSVKTPSMDESELLWKLLE